LAKRSPHRLLGGRCLLAVSVVLLLAPRPLSAGPPEGHAAGRTPIRADAPLTPDIERALAERFAPTLVYHGAEKYFPTSPLFSLETQVTIDPAAADATSLAARLGTAGQRREYYESLSSREKASLARVFYRVYDSRLGREPVVVIEYWLYYVQNTYRVRGNLFPVWVDGNHPNDLEHVHVVVHRDSEGNYALYEVDGSAHTGTMPANRHRFGPEESPTGTRFIIELGSHANAPDIDADGIFTAGIDGESGYKVLWGIRDRGITWARSRPKYMDARTGANAVTFEAATADGDAADRLTYRLVPVGDLTDAFSALDLSVDERNALFETQRNWFRRMFGGDNGSPDKLLVPPPRRPGEGGIGIEPLEKTQRGILVGTQLNLEQQGGLVGARYAYLFGRAYIPDVVFEADGILTRYQRHVETRAMVSYPLDGSTTLMFGKAVVVDALHPDRRQWDWVASVEFPVGHMRVSFASRSWGPLTKYSKEVRLSYFF
jgi:hypothetical protein